MHFLCWHFNFNASPEIISLFNLFVTQHQYISCRRSLTADTKRSVTAQI
jgi:hypothetical protein